MSGPVPTVRVWDLGVRLFHWSLVAGVAAAWTLTDPRMLHRGIGYVVVGLVGFRLVWGLIGPRRARFADFVRAPGPVIRYLDDMGRGRELRHLGHNPAGGAMVVALLVTLVGVAATGYMMGMDAFFGVEWVEGAHETLVDGLLVLVLLHVAGVLWASLRHRENLVAAMIHGRKAAHDPAAAE